jgi:hypothetical protein
VYALPVQVIIDIAITVMTRPQRALVYAGFDMLSFGLFFKRLDKTDMRFPTCMFYVGAFT